jgi:hypothetical protein
VSTKGTSAGPWTIYFSEPVDLATLEASKLLTVNGKSFGGCIHLNGTCGPAPKVRMDVIDFLPNGSPPPPGSPGTSVEISINAGAEGSPRTVQDGAVVSQEQVANGKLAGATSAWFDCQQGTAKCWRDKR